MFTYGKVVLVMMQNVRVQFLFVLVYEGVYPHNDQFNLKYDVYDLSLACVSGNV